MLRVGVDVGGTNTDAVLMDGRRLLAAYKTPTTADVEGGVVAAIGTLLHQQNVAAAAIGSVMIGTTQFTNAFVERRRLIPIGVIRIGLPATTSIPPLYDWPRALLDQIGTNVAIVGGGYEFDGRDIAPLDEAAVAATARGFRALGLRAVALSCVFAPVNASMEQRAADIVRNEMPDAQISISSAFGRIGLIERENATAMNACLGDLARTVGCRVTALTISPGQYAFAKQRVFDAGLGEKVAIKLQDYRDERGRYDRIASIEMFEAVGEAYWPRFFAQMRDRLVPDGIAGLQVITIRDSLFESYRGDIDFIRKYVFPGGMLPSPSKMVALGASHGFRLATERVFGGDYARTLVIWRERFRAAWPSLTTLGFDERFRRLWEYYLAYCEAGFRTGMIDVRQMVFSKSG